MQVLDEQQSINEKIASQALVIVQKSVQGQPKKPKRKGFLGIFGKKEEATSSATTIMLHSLNRTSISEQKAQKVANCRNKPTALRFVMQNLIEICKD